MVRTGRQKAPRALPSAVPSSPSGLHAEPWAPMVLAGQGPSPDLTEQAGGFEQSRRAGLATRQDFVGTRAALAHGVRAVLRVLADQRVEVSGEAGGGVGTQSVEGRVVAAAGADGLDQCGQGGRLRLLRAPGTKPRPAPLRTGPGQHRQRTAIGQGGTAYLLQLTTSPSTRRRRPRRQGGAQAVLVDDEALDGSEATSSCAARSRLSHRSRACLFKSRRARPRRHLGIASCDSRGVHQAALRGRLI